MGDYNIGGVVPPPLLPAEFITLSIAGEMVRGEELPWPTSRNPKKTNMTYKSPARTGSQWSEDGLERDKVLRREASEKQEALLEVIQTQLQTLMNTTDGDKEAYKK